MFPIKDDNPQLQTPYVTYAIICLNLLAWFVLQGLGSHPVLGQSVCQFGLIPADLFNDFTYDTSQWPCPPMKALVGRDSSARCLCTVVGCTYWVTYGFFGYLAITSRTPWAINVLRCFICSAA